MNLILFDLLSKAMPFVEDAETDPAYKPGAVKELAQQIREAIEGYPCGYINWKPVPFGTLAVGQNFMRGGSDIPWSKCKPFTSYGHIRDQNAAALFSNPLHSIWHYDRISDSEPVFLLEKEKPAEPLGKLPASQVQQRPTQRETVP